MAAQAQPSPCDAARAAAAVGELNMLATLIGSQPASGDDHFKLEQLFSANLFTQDAAGNTVEVIEIDGKAPSQYAHSLDAIRQQMDVGGAGGGGAAAPDLLDLMDDAGN